jgi:hypothetical protein
MALYYFNVRNSTSYRLFYCRKIENERFLVLEMAFRMNSSFFNWWYAFWWFERLFSYWVWIAHCFFLFVLGILLTATAFHTKLIYSNIKTIPTHLILIWNHRTNRLCFDYVASWYQMVWTASRTDGSHGK